MEHALLSRKMRRAINAIIPHLAFVDFYKFSMGQLIWKLHFNDVVTFRLKVRTKGLRLANLLDEVELREQLDHARSLRFDKNFLIWLGHQTFYGKEGIFEPAYIKFLATLQLPEYELSFDRETGEIEFRARGRWAEVTFWETIVMSIVNTMAIRARLALMPDWAIDVMFSRANAKLYAKLERLSTLDRLNFSDFSTRRSFDAEWQLHAIRLAREVLGKRFSGTSNVYFAYTEAMEAIGTNAHELPMVYAAKASAGSDEDVRKSQYRVLQDWRTMYGERMSIFLPDTFGTTQFFEGAPPELVYWKGARFDSKDPFLAGQEYIDFLQGHAQDPLAHTGVFADGLDVHIDGFAPNGNDIVEIYHHFIDRLNPGFGMGTLLGNDFIGCLPGQFEPLRPMSIVCKVEEVNGLPAVKLSDNYEKATGPAAAIERYRRIFGSKGVANAPTIV